jgi:hypothetical protein
MTREGSRWEKIQKVTRERARVPEMMVARR